MSEQKREITVEEYAGIVSSKVFEEQTKAAEEGLRDSFAHAAINALIVANNGDADACRGLGICKDAYLIADNMVKVRKEPPTKDQ